MSFVLEIGGVDFSPRYVLGSLQIEHTLGGRSSASFAIDEDVGGAFVPRDRLGQDVRIFNADGLHFGGTLLQVSSRIPGELNAEFTERTCQATGYSEIADRRVVNGQFGGPGETAGSIVRELFGTYLEPEGVAEGFIDDGPPVENLSLSWGTVTQALDELTRVAGASYGWTIDREKKLYFIPRGYAEGPRLDSANLGDLIDFRVTDTRVGYRNVQYVEGGEGVTAERAEIFTSDGRSATFTLGLPLAELSSIEVGGVPVDPVDIGVREVDLTPWSYQVGSEEIGVNTDPAAGGTVPVAGSVVTVRYAGYYPLTSQRFNSTGIAFIQALQGGTGRYEATHSAPQAESRQELRDIASGLLNRHREFRQIVSWQSERHGWNPGQTVVVEIPELGVLGEFIVARVSLRDLGGELQDTVLRASVEAEAASGAHEWLEFLREFFNTRKPYRVRANQVIDTPVGIAGDIELEGVWSWQTGHHISDPMLDPSTLWLVGPGTLARRSQGEFFGPTIGYPEHVTP